MHHLHIKSLAVYDIKGDKIDLEFFDASPAVKEGDSGRTPHRAIDGTTSTTHNAFGSTSSKWVYGSEDHWMEFVLLRRTRIGRITIQNTAGHNSNRLVGSVVDIRGARYVIENFVVTQDVWEVNFTPKQSLPLWMPAHEDSLAVLSALAFDYMPEGTLGYTTSSPPPPHLTAHLTANPPPRYPVTSPPLHPNISPFHYRHSNNKSIYKPNKSPTHQLTAPQPLPLKTTTSWRVLACSRSSARCWTAPPRTLSLPRHGSSLSFSSLAASRAQTPPERVAPKRPVPWTGAVARVSRGGAAAARSDLASEAAAAVPAQRARWYSR